MFSIVTINVVRVSFGRDDHTLMNDAGAAPLYVVKARFRGNWPVVIVTNAQVRIW